MFNIRFFYLSFSLNKTNASEWWIHYNSQWKNTTTINKYIELNRIFINKNADMWTTVYFLCYSIYFRLHVLFSFFWISCEGLCIYLFCNTSKWKMLTKKINNNKQFIMAVFILLSTCQFMVGTRISIILTTQIA